MHSNKFKIFWLILTLPRLAMRRLRRQDRSWRQERKLWWWQPRRRNSTPLLSRSSKSKLTKCKDLYLAWSVVLSLFQRHNHHHDQKNPIRIFFPLFSRRQRGKCVLCVCVWGFTSNLSKRQRYPRKYLVAQKLKCHIYLDISSKHGEIVTKPSS